MGCVDGTLVREEKNNHFIGVSVDNPGLEIGWGHWGGAKYHIMRGGKSGDAMGPVLTIL